MPAADGAALLAAAAGGRTAQGFAVRRVPGRRLRLGHHAPTHACTGNNHAARLGSLSARGTCRRSMPHLACPPRTAVSNGAGQAVIWCLLPVLRWCTLGQRGLSGGVLPAARCVPLEMPSASVCRSRRHHFSLDFFCPPLARHLPRWISCRVSPLTRCAQGGGRGQGVGGELGSGHLQQPTPLPPALSRLMGVIAPHPGGGTAGPPVWEGQPWCFMPPPPPEKGAATTAAGPSSCGLVPRARLFRLRASASQFRGWGQHAGHPSSSHAPPQVSAGPRVDRGAPCPCCLLAEHP